MDSSYLNNTTPNTTTSAATSTISYMALFAPLLCIGSVALVCNIAILQILLSDRKFLKKSAFLFALNVSNLFVALAFTYANAYRITVYLLGAGSIKSSATSCLITFVPELYFLAFSSPAFVLAINGVERLAAVLVPTWYFTQWKPVKNWRLVGLAYTCIGISVIATCVHSSLTVVSDLITKLCLWNYIAGELFAAYFYMVSVVGGLCAVLASLTSFCVGTYQYSRLPIAYNTVELRKRAKRQLQLTKAMLTVASLDFVLIVIPNFCLALNNVFHYQLPLGGNYSLYMYNANALFNMFAHVVFNSEFRKIAIRFFRLDKFKWFQGAIVASKTLADGGMSARVVPSNA